MLAFIAHFLNFSKSEIYEMTLDEINFWFGEGYKLWGKINIPGKGK